MRRGDYYFLIEDPCHREDSYPAVDVYLTEEEIYLLLDVPGIPRESLEIKMDAGYVEISGSRNEPESFSQTTHFYKLESFFGSFRRRILLPVEAEFDKAVITLADGVLKIRIPRLRLKVIEIPVQ